MNRIRFKFAPDKAVAAVHWMVQQQPGIDLHTLLKACYFADKEHLNKHGRPVFGAIYRAMRFGPVPLEIYEIAKGEALWLAEVGRENMPWRLNGFKLSLTSNDEPAMDSLSESDFDAVSAGFEKSRSLDFSQRTAATHGPDWQAAKLGHMRYEDMLEDRPEKAEQVACLREAGPYMRI